MSSFSLPHRPVAMELDQDARNAVPLPLIFQLLDGWGNCEREPPSPVQQDNGSEAEEIH